LLYTAVGVAAYLLAGCITGLLVSYFSNVSKELENRFQTRMTALAIVLWWPSALLDFIARRLESHD
jgi:hypothetical protein